MKDRYDFSKGKRGRIVPAEPEPQGKVRTTIRLDQDIVDRFFQMAEASGGAIGCQTLINAALLEYLDGEAPRFEDALRRIIREELNPAQYKSIGATRRRGIQKDLPERWKRFELRPALSRRT